MFKKILFTFLAISSSIYFAFGCGMQSPTEGPKKAETIVVPGGTLLPTLGIGFEVNYDPSLDNLIPGYKILTVGYTNNSMNIIQLDQLHDKWMLDDRTGRSVKAIINLRNDDPDVWGKLQKKLKILMEYPLLIPIGATQMIDLIFPAKVNLNEFRSVTFKPAVGGQNFKILPRED